MTSETVDGSAERGRRLLYIGGEGRSGSTVLEQALAVHPDITAVGELKYLWRWGLGRNELCGCGEPVRQCPFWTGVATRLFGPEGFDSPEAAERFNEYEAVAANRGMFAAYLTPVRPSARRRMTRVGDFLGRLYQAIADEAGVSVVIDSSKHPMHLAVVARIPDADLKVIQLVRDPRGVVTSWSKKVPLPHDPTGERTMGPHPASVVSIRWMLTNLAVDHIRRLRGGTVVRYEEFCMEPKRVLDELVDLAGLDPSGITPVDGEDSDRTVSLAGGHGIAGNPVRFGGTTITLREDTRWRKDLSTAKRVAVKAALLPQLIQYRYIGRPSRWTSASASPQRSTTSTT
jgi:hypothetical protein